MVFPSFNTLRRLHFQRKYIFCVYMNRFMLLMNVLKDVEVDLRILDVSTISRMTNKFVLRPDRNEFPD